MLYDTLKILHILSATLLITSLSFCVYSWWTMKTSVVAVMHIQKQTCFYLIPLALFQLITGFTMISLNHYSTERWVKESVIGFLIVMISWLAFNYFLLSQNSQSLFARRMQSIFLFICSATLLSMIFFMANKI